MLNLALTGNVAAGKSTVAALFRRWGATLIDADELVRETQVPGSPVLQAIAERFGADVIRPDGGLDRDRLRRQVLDDPALRQALEAIVHPAVQALRLARAEAARAAGVRVLVHDIPLLFEVAAREGGGLDPGRFDAVVLVDAPEALRQARLVATRGLGAEEAARLIATQLPAAVKRAWRGGPRDRSAYLIENDADLPALERRARAVWDAILRDRAA